MQLYSTVKVQRDEKCLFSVVPSDTISLFSTHFCTIFLSSIGCLLVKLHVLVKLLYKLCYHLDGE